MKIELAELPQFQKNHSIVKLEAGQEKVMVLFVNYQSSEQNQPVRNEEYNAQAKRQQPQDILIQRTSFTVSNSKSASNTASVRACKNKRKKHVRTTWADKDCEIIFILAA